MKKHMMIFGAMLMMLSCVENTTQNNQQEKTNEPEKDGILLHITHDHDDPHRVLMPLQMAITMAPEKDVMIYLDIDAVNLVTKDAEDMTYEHFTPLKEAINKLLEMGVSIYACPGCMKIAGIEESDLAEGIQVAEKEKFFNFTEGNIVSLSY
ncbi:MAG: DsrE family protein [Bacteroidota bacterium]